MDKQTVTQKIISYIEQHPGCTSRDISANVPEIEQKTPFFLKCRLYDLVKSGRLERSGHMRNYEYSAAIKEEENDFSYFFDGKSDGVDDILEDEDKSLGRFKHIHKHAHEYVVEVPPKAVISVFHLAQLTN